MDYGRLMEAINKRLFFVLVTVMLAVLGAGVACMLIPVNYQARAVMTLNRYDQATGELIMDYNSLMMYRQLARTYSELAAGKPMLEKLAVKLGGGLTAEQLGQMVRVRKVKDLELLEVVVQDANPVRAARIANSMCDILLRHETQVWKMNNLRLLIPALPDSKPVGPDIMLAVLVAAAAGLCISVLTVLAVDYRELKA